MRAAKMQLKDYFREELSALRTESVEFSEKHPELARTLGLNAKEATDPQVELLLQSFSFLTGRLRHQIEKDKAAMPNALLAYLYPHLDAPMPAMLIAQIQAKPNGSDFSKEHVLPRDRYILATAMNHLGQKAECRFKTSSETPLLALVINAIEMEPASQYSFGGGKSMAQSVLRVQLSIDGTGQIQSKGKGPARLRFYIDSTEPGAFALYEMLALHLTNIGIVTKAGTVSRLLPESALRWLGMEAQEAMLLANPHTHPGYRLLQEYFTFQEKFLFFELGQLDQLDFSDLSNQFDLLFVLDTPFEPMRVFSKHTLRLNCVPLINLFSQRIEPLALTHGEYEYKLKGDVKNHRYCEVYAIEELESISSKGSPRQIAPYFEMEEFGRHEQHDYFYVTRREQAEGHHIAGNELFVSFLDQQFSLTQLVDEVVGGRALCTNRRLPEKIPAGCPLRLEGAGPPIAAITALTAPTPHQTPPKIGPRPWMLVSQLSLNHLSLSDGPAALAALKNILRLHLGPNSRAGHKQIDAILNLRQRPVVRHVGREGWRGFVRGVELTLVMDREAFDADVCSPVLFCSVLRHFFRLYASVNHLIELNLETSDIKGIQKQWLPLAGVTAAL